LHTVIAHRALSVSGKFEPYTSKIRGKFDVDSVLFTSVAQVERMNRTDPMWGEPGRDMRNTAVEKLVAQVNSGRVK